MPSTSNFQNREVEVAQLAYENGLPAVSLTDVGTEEAYMFHRMRKRNTIGRAMVTFAFGLLVSVQSTRASELTYTPVNPSFGGSPLNGSYVLGLASANNSLFQQKKTTTSPTSSTAVAQFQSVITSALLSQIASTVAQEIIGPNAKNSGTFNINGQMIKFYTSGGEINIGITDSLSGATTQIQIPVPTY
jgi:curli production assembly/transport component CsgF